MTFINKSHSQATKDKIGKASKGRVSWNKGKKSPKTSGKNHWNFGKKTSNKVKIKISESMSNEGNHNWQGDKAKYNAIHMWVRRHKGKPQTCVDCNITSKERRLQWSNIDHKYLRNLDDYVGRCSSCHKIYDLKLGR